MPGLWLWLLLLSIVLLITFAIVFEFLGAKWYSWFILGLGLVFYFFSIIAYIFRRKECHKHEKKSLENNENVTITSAAPVSAAPVSTTPVSTTPVSTAPSTVSTTSVSEQVRKPSHRVGVGADF